jgi:hypothetical protein
LTVDPGNGYSLMPKKEIRFRDLVKLSGTPEVVSLWSDPKQDRSFMKAVRENRVLTVIQEPASKTKDFGKIGFFQKPHASFLVFPEPLRGTPDSRVIGIKYDLVQQRKVKDPLSKKDLKAPSRKSRMTKAPKTFNVLVRRVATVEDSVPVTAPSRDAAKQRVLQALKRQPFDLSKAIIRNEVRSVE